MIRYCRTRCPGHVLAAVIGPPRLAGYAGPCGLRAVRNPLAGAEPETEKMKGVIRAFDNLFLKHKMQRRREKKLIKTGETSLSSDLGYKFVVYHKKNASDLFSQLCDKYGSDKGETGTVDHPYSWPSHTYADYYSRLFAHCRQSVRNVFECGLGTNNLEVISNMGAGGKPGASLRVWRDYFPNAMIYGADIDRGILFQEDRIETHYIDQLDPVAIKAFWEQIETTVFDLMIDDGLHTFEAGSCLFENSISRLSQNGLYIIEDVLLDDLLRYKVYFENLDFVVDYVIMFRPNAELDSGLVAVRRPSPGGSSQISR